MPLKITPQCANMFTVVHRVGATKQGGHRMQTEKAPDMRHQTPALLGLTPSLSMNAPSLHNLGGGGGGKPFIYSNLQTICCNR